MTTDPRELGGDISGPGGPLDRNSVVFDTTRAVLLDGAVAAVMHSQRAGDMFGVLLEGRINRSQDRAKVLFLMDGDGLAALATEAMSAGWQAGIVGGMAALYADFREAYNRRREALLAQGLLPPQDAHGG